MADLSTFFPGGAQGTPVQHAVEAINADQVDFIEHDGIGESNETGFKFWVGALADAPVARDTETLYIFTS